VIKNFHPLSARVGLHKIHHLLIERLLDLRFIGKIFERGVKVMQLEALFVQADVMAERPSIMNCHFVRVRPRRIELHTWVWLIKIIIWRFAVVF